jgi:hypothetical protein
MLIFLLPLFGAGGGELLLKTELCLLSMLG